MICVFKCVNCGDKMEYSLERECLVCHTCQSEMDVADYDSDSITYEGGLDLGDDINQYTCPSCGAVILSANQEATMECGYCGVALAFFGDVQGELSPEMIIPCKLTREQAVNKVKQWWMEHETMPDYDEKELKMKWRNIYVPVWLADVEAETKMSAVVSLTEIEDSKWDYRDMPEQISALGCYSEFQNLPKHHTKETNKIVTKKLRTVFRKMPANASTNFSNTRFHGIEPYEYEEMEKFQPAYLSGHQAERYVFQPADVIPGIIKRASQYGTNQCKAHLLAAGGPGGQLTHTMSGPVHVQLKNIYYALVPIWVCSYHYEGKRHFIYVNGQTGKTDGEIIFNKKKFIKEIVVYAETTFPLWYAMAMFLFTFGNYVKRVGILIMPLVVVGITAGQFFKGQRNQRGSLFEKVELDYHKKTAPQGILLILLKCIGALIIFGMTLTIRYRGMESPVHTILVPALLLSVPVVGFLTMIYGTKRKKELLRKDEVEYRDYLPQKGTIVEESKEAEL